MRKTDEERELVRLTPSEQTTCRNERTSDLAALNVHTPRGAVTERWILAGCKACGLCVEMTRS